MIDILVGLVLSTRCMSVDNSFKKGFNVENGQSDVYLKTNDRSVVAKYLNSGWKIFDKENYYYLRAPSISLVDLTDPNKLIAFGSPQEALAYHNCINYYVQSGIFNELLNFVLKKFSYIFNSLEVFFVNGPIVESEFRIQGSDERIKAFGQLLRIEIEKSDDYKKSLIYAKDFLGNTRRVSYMNYNLRNQNNYIRDYFEKLESVFFDVGNVYNDIIYNEMFKDCGNFDKYLVSPNGCFKYLSSLVFNKISSIDNIVFYEIHSDPNRKSGKKYNFNMRKTDTVLAIDSLYSGNSLKKLSLLSDNIKVLGMYPKSRVSMQNCDYVMICDKIVHKSDINSSSKWYYYELKKVLSY